MNTKPSQINTGCFQHVGKCRSQPAETIPAPVRSVQEAKSTGSSGFPGVLGLVRPQNQSSVRHSSAKLFWVRPQSMHTCVSARGEGRMQEGTKKKKKIQSKNQFMILL